MPCPCRQLPPGSLSARAATPRHSRPPRRIGVPAAGRRGMASTMLLDGRRILVTGVLTESSIAFTVARRAQEEGAEVLLTGFGRGLRITRRVARRLPSEPDVLELDVNDPAQLEAVAAEVAAPLGAPRRRGPRDRLRPRRRARRRTSSPRRPTRPWRGSARARSPTRRWRRRWPSRWRAARAAARSWAWTSTRRSAWPVYDWAGVAKAALESVSRYVARDLGPRGVRSNLVSAGPLRTVAAGVDRRVRRAGRPVAAAGAAGLGPRRPRAGGRRRACSCCRRSPAR